MQSLLMLLMLLLVICGTAVTALLFELLTKEMPFILLNGSGQVQRDVPEPDGLGEMVLDSCALLCNTYTETGRMLCGLV